MALTKSPTWARSCSLAAVTRPLKRAMQRSLLDPLSLEILAGRFREGDTITADAVDGKIVFTK